MTIWYKVIFNQISKIKILRSTEKSVWIENKVYGPSRHAKKSDFYNFFETFDKAKEFLIKRQQNRELKARKHAENELKLLHKMFQIKEEDIK